MFKYVAMSVISLSAVCFAQEAEIATNSSESSVEVRDVERSVEVTVETPDVEVSVEVNQAE